MICVNKKKRWKWFIGSIDQVPLCDIIQEETSNHYMNASILTEDFITEKKKKNKICIFSCRPHTCFSQYITSVLILLFVSSLLFSSLIDVLSLLLQYCYPLPFSRRVRHSLFSPLKRSLDKGQVISIGVTIKGQHNQLLEIEQCH